MGRPPLGLRASIALAAVLSFAAAWTACSTPDPPHLAPAPVVAPAGATAGAEPARAAPSAPVASDAVQTPLACGDDGGSGCTLHAWMNANLSAPLRGRDCSGLVPLLERVVALGPPASGGYAPYANWASIARDGADAARVDDVEAVKASCRGCHAQYRDRYKKELHDRKI